MGSEANSLSASSSSSTSAPASSPPPPPPPATAMSSSSSSSSSSPSGKRSRDPEDEVYVDNLHSHKRYLSEIMASSLNGLTVGDAQPIPLPPDNLMESPARSETMFYLRDEMSVEYSPMSEDSDDSRYFETSVNMCSSLPDSRPTSPVSPYRNQRPSSGSTSTSYPAHSCPASPTTTATQPRQRGGSDSEGRFPSSPSDICHSADLRRAALLRSVQMRTQPTGPSSSSFDLQPSNSGQQEHANHHNMEAEYHGQCTYVKSLVDDPRGYQIEEECSVLSMESENHEKTCETLGTTLRSNDPGE
ncbi:OLC1v1004427C1 [Oldenlandia corymbosa var. corymbosa]|uniref:OLC1v1004427C1 n=1 Tax=Oldenlandia corymbosa var. corymbosa TaxID=529605 RepID=A0AAV1DDI9_OLDCO|nr:OLC1v1004427C1 [Oldenlandia corymbosa var. corymbosa]